MQSLRKVFSLRNVSVFGLGLSTGVVLTKPNGLHCNWTSKSNFNKKIFSNQPEKKWDDNWDGLTLCPGTSQDDPKNLTTPSKAIRTIVLVRHGQYNFDGKQENEAHHLTPLGREQAQILGQRLRKLRDEVGGFRSIVYSPLLRTTETAAIACKEMGETDFEADPLLKEAIPGPPDPVPPSFKMDDNLEKQTEDSRQLESAFRKYFYRAKSDQKEDSCEVLVCHSNVIRYFVCRALQLGPGAWLRFEFASLDHTSLTVIKIFPDGQVRLERYADSTHLPDEKRTFRLEP